MEFSSSTRLAIQFGSSTSRLAASRLRMNITPKKKKGEKKQDKNRIRDLRNMRFACFILNALGYPGFHVKVSGTAECRCGTGPS